MSREPRPRPRCWMGRASACVHQCSSGCHPAGFVNPRWVQRRGQQRARRAARALAILSRDGPGEPLAAPVSCESGGYIVEAVADSGAEDSVTPPNVFPGVVSPSPMSRAGRNYRAAHGAPIPNLGQTSARFEDGNCRARGIPFQVAEVTRPLLSVASMAAAGCRVSFQGDSGEILCVAPGR